MYTTAAKVRLTGGCKSIPQDEVSDNEIEKFIVRAESFINGALCKRYHVPFASDSVPPLIETLTLWGASYLTMTEYPDLVFEKDIENLWNRFIELLDRLVDGTLSLDGVDEIGVGVFDVAVEGSHKGNRWIR